MFSQHSSQKQLSVEEKALQDFLANSIYFELLNNDKQSTGKTKAMLENIIPPVDHCCAAHDKIRIQLKRMGKELNSSTTFTDAIKRAKTFNEINQYFADKITKSSSVNPVTYEIERAHTLGTFFNENFNNTGYYIYQFWLEFETFKANYYDQLNLASSRVIV